MSKIRPIKFKGYNKKNGVWLYGFYLQNRGAHFVAPDEFADGKTWEDYEVDPESVGQFIGLDDDCGKEIYEGDLIKYGDSAFDYKIVWDGPLFCLQECGNGDKFLIDDLADIHIHVVGNSYNMGQ